MHRQLAEALQRRKKFLNNSASDPNKCFPIANVEVLADHSQRKGKPICVRENDTIRIRTVLKVSHTEKPLTLLKT